MTSAASLPARASLLFRLALRDLRGGLKGFGIFIACLALGVAAIAGIGAMSHALTEGLAREGRVILGGDLAFTLLQREASPVETAFLSRYGALSSLASMRAMAQTETDAALVELKAVDGAYPSAGTVLLDPDRPLADLLAETQGVYGAAADPALFARLGLKPGDTIALGAARIVLRAAIKTEPDRIAAGIGFGPRLLLSKQALQATNLLQPGSLARWIYRLDLPQASDERLDRIMAEVKTALPEAGWEMRSRSNADPRFSKNIERFTQFLMLVGLTALLVGGIGVANAVDGFIARKRTAIATLKSLGMPGGRAVALHLVEIALIASVSIVIGLIVGGLMPFLTLALFKDAIPLPLAPSFAPGQALLAAFYGLLTAFVFAILPLGRAHEIPASQLFREDIDPKTSFPRRVYIFLFAIAALALLLVSIFSAYDSRIAAMFLAGAAGAFLLLRLTALAIMALARRLPRPYSPMLRLALGNLHRPGALTPTLVLSLGLGITLLVTLALIDSNLTRQLTRTLPQRAPSFFFLDVPVREVDAFKAFLTTKMPDATTEAVPMMRGRLVALKGVPVENIKASDDIAWVLDGDRGISYSDALPEGSKLTAGEWWKPGYEGEPLVSFDSAIAKGLGLIPGDEIVVNVLGRNVTARIANLREVEWRTLGINFVMLFSANTFKGAPHTYLATLTQTAQPGGDTLLRDIGRIYPNVTAVRVKEALEAVNGIVEKLVLAIRAASLIALLASLLVLGGALAAGHQARLYDAVILKTLGATRARLLYAYCLEYGMLGLATALFGCSAGTLAAYAIVAQVMKLPFTFAPAGAFFAAGLAVIVTLLLGLAGTWRILGKKPSVYLRNL